MFTFAAEFHFPLFPKLQQDGNADIGGGCGESHAFGRAARLPAAEPYRIKYQLACPIGVRRAEPHLSQVLSRVVVDVKANWAGKVKCAVFLIQLRSRIGNADWKAALPVVALKPITDVLGHSATAPYGKNSEKRVGASYSVPETSVIKYLLLQIRHPAYSNNRIPAPNPAPLFTLLVLSRINSSLDLRNFSPRFNRIESP